MKSGKKEKEPKEGKGEKTDPNEGECLGMVSMWHYLCFFQRRLRRISWVAKVVKGIRGEGKGRSLGTSCSSPASAIPSHDECLLFSGTDHV